MGHIQFDGDGSIRGDDDVGKNARLAGFAIAGDQRLAKVSRDWVQRSTGAGM
jgi:hypothetical protein